MPTTDASLLNRFNEIDKRNTGSIIGAGDGVIERHNFKAGELEFNSQGSDTTGPTLNLLLNQHGGRLTIDDLRKAIKEAEGADNILPG
jgi:hypothetical protein